MGDPFDPMQNMVWFLSSIPPVVGSGTEVAGGAPKGRSEGALSGVTSTLIREEELGRNEHKKREECVWGQLSPMRKKEP